MADERLSELLRQAPFSFVGTIEKLGAATMADVPTDERTAVVQVDRVLHSDPAFVHLKGEHLTVRLAADADPPAVGDTAAFFVQGAVFGASIVVEEVGRLPVEAVQPYLARADAPGGRGAFDPELGELAARRVAEHAATADAVVVGRVLKLENVLGLALSEHDPDWWKATLQVHHVERGNVDPGELGVVYPNSIDVRWHRAPKPRPSEEGVWLLHATTGELREIAPFEAVHSEDYRPLHELDRIRAAMEQQGL